MLSLFYKESDTWIGGFEVGETSYSPWYPYFQNHEHLLNITLAKGAIKKVRSAKVGKKTTKSKAIKRVAKAAPVADAGAAKSPVRSSVKRGGAKKATKKAGTKRTGAKKAAKGKKAGKARAKN
jgi:hypothetical protein